MATPRSALQHLRRAVADASQLIGQLLSVHPRFGRPLDGARDAAELLGQRDRLLAEVRMRFSDLVSPLSVPSSRFESKNDARKCGRPLASSVRY